MESKTLKVVELFAGVGGFRLGLEKSNYKIVWSNQWEPSTKIQHASKVYEARFGKENHSNEDINEVVQRNVEEIPDYDLGVTRLMADRVFHTRFFVPIVSKRAQTIASIPNAT
ncbi:DNA cytosine methyltransferase [Psychroflexus sp. MBR-150]|jgi:hypothetical protein